MTLNPQEAEPKKTTPEPIVERTRELLGGYLKSIIADRPDIFFSATALETFMNTVRGDIGGSYNGEEFLRHFRTTELKTQHQGTIQESITQSIVLAVAELRAAQSVEAAIDATTIQTKILNPDAQSNILGADLQFSFKTTSDGKTIIQVVANYLLKDKFTNLDSQKLSAEPHIVFTLLPNEGSNSTPYTVEMIAIPEEFAKVHATTVVYYDQYFSALGMQDIPEDIRMKILGEVVNGPETDATRQLIAQRLLSILDTMNRALAKVSTDLSQTGLSRPTIVTKCHNLYGVMDRICIELEEFRSVLRSYSVNKKAIAEYDQTVSTIFDLLEKELPILKEHDFQTLLHIQERNWNVIKSDTFAALAALFFFINQFYISEDPENPLATINLFLFLYSIKVIIENGPLSKTVEMELGPRPITQTFTSSSITEEPPRGILHP